MPLLEISEEKQLRIRIPRHNVNGSITMVSTNGKVWDCILAYETEEVRYDDFDWEDKFEAIFGFDSEEQREEIVRKNALDDFNYKRSSHLKLQDNCRLAASLQDAQVKHLKWNPEEMSLELQLVETHEGCSRTLATTNYFHLFLKFEEICFAPLKRAKFAANLCAKTEV